jgi:hypothetical protein
MDATEFTPYESESRTTHTREVDEVSLPALAAAVRTAIEYAQKHAKRAVDSARTVGQNLMLAKCKVPHGEWESWIAQNTPLSARTAQAYMKLAASLDELPPEKAQRVALLPIREALCAIGGSSSRRSTKTVRRGARTDLDELRDSGQAWSTNLRTTIAGLERLAYAIDAETPVSRSALAKLSHELATVMDLIRNLQRDCLQGVDGHDAQDGGSHD